MIKNIMRVGAITLMYLLLGASKGNIVVGLGSIIMTLCIVFFVIEFIKEMDPALLIILVLIFSIGVIYMIFG